MKVRVKESIQENFVGFFNHARRRPGDVFVIGDTPRRALFPGEKRLIANDAEAAATYEQIKDAEGSVPQEFSLRWMEPVDRSTPEKVSTSQQALDQKSTVIKQEKAASRSTEAPPAGERKTDVI